MIRTVFMGTPDFAVPTLQALLADPAYDVVGVVTQPDREAGRGRRQHISPVKAAALAAGAPILQPLRLRDPDAVAALAALQPDLIVVAAYGQILRPPVLELPRFGCVNVHASLLPRWRGAAPINAALLAGDAITGCTIMMMDAGMDTGPILAQAEMPIRPEDTAASLGERLAQQGAALLTATLPAYLGGALRPRSQPDEGVTICRPLKKEQGRIDWTQSAEVIERMARAYDPWPGAYTSWQGSFLKLGRVQATVGAGQPGRVQPWAGKVAVGTGQGLLVIDTLQLEGKKMLDIDAFLRGRPDFLGALLGES